MRMNRFTTAVLIGVVLCMSGDDRCFGAGNGDGNKNVASSATVEDATMREAAYRARLAARAAADAGFHLGKTRDFRAAREKFSQAIELDPGFSPAYRLRAMVCLQMCDWTGAIVDLDRLITLDPNHPDIFNERGYARRQLGDLHGAQDDFDCCIALGTNRALAYANRAEVEKMLGNNWDAAADLAHAQSLAPARPPAASSTPPPGARKKQAHHDTTGTSSDAKGTTR
jgi:tetratricopeptide (TPR) repeat protein